MLSILLTIIFSILTFYFIEKPFRNKNIISIKKFIIYISISISSLIIYDLYILKNEGLKNRFASIISEVNFFQINSSKFVYSSDGKLGTVLLIGDSHAGMLRYELNNKLKKKYSLIELNSQLYVNNFKKVHRKKESIIQQRGDDIINDNKKIENFLKENKNLIVILSQRWSHKLLGVDYYNKDYNRKENNLGQDYLEPINIKTFSEEERKRYLSEGLKQTISNILKQEHTLILIYPIPEIGFNAPRVINKYLLFSSNLHGNIPIFTMSYDDYKERNKEIYKILDSVQGINIYRVYPDKLFCSTLVLNKCIINNSKHLFYSDEHHLTLEGSKYIVNDIMKIIKKIR